MGSICNLIAQCSLYYQPISTNGFDLFTLVDNSAKYSFESF